MDRAPRVLVATTNFPLRRRGDVTGNFVVDPLLALSDELDLRVLAPLDTHIAAADERFAGAVPVHRFRYWWPRSAQRVAYGHGIPTNLRSGPLVWLQLVAFVAVMAWQIVRRSKDVDVIHAHWLPVALLAVPARLIRRAPLVLTIHGTDVTQFPEWFVRWGLRRVDVVVSAHDDLLRTAERLAPDVRRERIRHLVQPQPVEDADRDEVAAELGDAPTVVFVSRLSPERDPLTFVRAAAHVRESRRDVRFALVGDGPLRDDVHAEITRLGLQDTVAAFGHRPDVWTFLERGAAFTALSDRNNIWVTVVVEAMRGGVPLIATRAGDTEAALRDDVDALLVPVADAEAVAGAILRVLDDPDTAARLTAGATATLAANGFDPDAVLAATRSLYAELAAAS